MVIDIKDFPKLRETELKGKTIVATCLFGDPLHPGHASCITESKKFGDVLVVIVNGDMQCITKKGKPFMPAIDRANLIDHLRGVDYVVIYDHPTEYSIIGAFEFVKPDVFTKGGDRNLKDANDPNSPLYKEVRLIQSYGGRVEYNVGDPKIWSSSDYLQEWVDFVNSKKK